MPLAPHLDHAPEICQRTQLASLQHVLRRHIALHELAGCHVGTRTNTDSTDQKGANAHHGAAPNHRGRLLRLIPVAGRIRVRVGCVSLECHLILNDRSVNEFPGDDAVSADRDMIEHLGPVEDAGSGADPHPFGDAAVVIDEHMGTQMGPMLDYAKRTDLNLFRDRRRPVVD